MTVRVFLFSLAVVLFLDLPVSCFACDNGLYIEQKWIRQKQIEADYRAFFEALMNANIRDIYVKVGRRELRRPARVRAFMNRAKQSLPGVRVHGWIGRRVCGRGKKSGKCLSLPPEKNITAIVNISTRIWKMGFDGVHLNFEPIESGNYYFVNLLRRVKKVKPVGRLLSVAGFSLAPFESGEGEFSFEAEGSQMPYFWKRDYYTEILSNVNHLVVMNYDTAIRRKGTYRDFTSWQTAEFLKLISGKLVELRIGLPTFDHGRKGLFDGSSENLEIGSKGVKKALPESKGCPPGFGVVIFREKTTSEEEWSLFRKNWAPFRTPGE